MSPTVLTPVLLPLDERVLARLDPEVGRRAVAIADDVAGAAYWRCTACGREAPCTHDSRGAWRKGTPIACLRCWDREYADGGMWLPASRRPRTLHPIRLATFQQRREVREVLRGLECTGYATCVAGWWRSARSPEPEVRSDMRAMALPL